jgi:hypothetical protein
VFNFQVRCRMTTDGLFFVAPDEPIDRKRGRVLRRLLVFANDGAIRAKIETQLTRTEADRLLVVDR